MTSGSPEEALNLWKEKLAALEKALVITYDVAIRFALQKQIEVCQKKIQKLTESIAIERVWENLCNIAEPTDYIISVEITGNEQHSNSISTGNKQRKRDLGHIPLEDRNDGQKKVPLDSQIKLTVELDQKQYLTLLDKGTSGKIYCLCPSSGFAPNSRLEPGITSFPQEDAKYPNFPVTGKEGQEEIIAIITDNPLDLEWWHVNSIVPARELTLEDLKQLLIELSRRNDWKAIRTAFYIT